MQLVGSRSGRLSRPKGSHWLRLGFILPVLLIALAGVRAPRPAFASTLTVNAGGPYSGAVNQSISMIGVASGASCGTPNYVYLWSFGDGQSGSTQSVQHTYTTSSGSPFPVTLFVTDSCGDSGQGPTTATVGGSGGSCTAPVGTSVAVAANPTSGTTSTNFQFTSAASGFGGSPTYQWNFGDSQTAGPSTVNTTNHTYTSSGTFTVNVTVTGNGVSGCASTSVTVTGGSGGGSSNVQVAPNGPYTGTTNQSVSFNGLALSYNSGATITTYTWTFGDGATGTGKQVSHTYTSAGTYTVTLSATDSTGQSNSATTTATITGSGSGGTGGGTGSNTANGVTANPNGPYTGSGGSTINFSATASTANSGASIVSYSWSFGDGTSASGQQVTHTYTTSGTYTVALTVTDSTGGVVTATTTATISGGSRVVTLVIGCNNIAATWADNTNASVVANAVSPQSALLSVWKLTDPSTAKYKGYFQNAGSASDLTSVNRLDAIFICVNAPATLSEPTV